jgi:hypothetical protein
LTNGLPHTFFAGIANANLGKIEDAKRLFEFVLKESSGDPNYSKAEIFLNKIKNR